MNVKKMIGSGMILMMVCQFYLPASAQNTLTIGDPAPSLAYSKVLKGKCIDIASKEQMHVVEFWATWCGPCVAAMPHLSDLAKKYKGTVDFVGVNIWEKTGEKPYESSLKEVEAFVATLGDKMSYNVIADNNAQFMSKEWMGRAGQHGIPCTFLIKDGKVMWIGHPAHIDSIIGKVQSGTFDLAANKKNFEAETQGMMKMMEEEKKVNEPILAALKAKEYDKALSLIEKASVEVPFMQYSLNARKLGTLLDAQREKDAIQFADEWRKKVGPYVGYSVGHIISEKYGLSTASYLAAIRNLELSIAEPMVFMVPEMYHTMAICFSRAGQPAKAAKAEEMAIKEAKTGLKEGKWPGKMNEGIIAKYEDMLKTYQQTIN